MYSNILIIVFYDFIIILVMQLKALKLIKFSEQLHNYNLKMKKKILRAGFEPATYG